MSIANGQLSTKGKFSLLIWNVQIKTTMYHMHAGMAKIERRLINQKGPICETTGNLICYRCCIKTVKLLSDIWQLLMNLNIHQTYYSPFHSRRSESMSMKKGL